MESIYNEINSVFINGQKLTPELLEYLAEIYIKDNHLEDYVKYLNISNNMICHGEYDNLNMRLSMSPETSYKDRIKELGLKHNDYKMPEKIYPVDEMRNWYLNQYYFSPNLIRELSIRVLHVLYHELTHAKQNFIAHEGDKALKEIINNEKVLMQNNYLAYTDFHDNFIMEYNANVEGYLEVHRLLEKIGDYRAKEVLLLARRYFMNQYKKKENYIYSPYEWMSNVFRVDKVDTKNLCLKDRILYGLPIEKAVYDEIKNMPYSHYRK